MVEPIVVVDWSPSWTSRFARYADRIQQALGDLPAEVEHVGSTAVSGLEAKPVIDIDVIARDDGHVAAIINRLGRIGYCDEGDLGVPGRRALSWPTDEERHHVYVVVAGSARHREHIVFRDHLRDHPATARAYGELKRRLASDHGADRAAYTAGKTNFIRQVLSARGPGGRDQVELPLT